MNDFAYLLQTSGAPAQGGDATTSMLMTFIPIVLVILVFYFLIIRPQNKKQKETQRMLDALQKGDKIVTIGGVHGTILSVKEGTVIAKVDDAVKLEFSRSAIASVTRAEDKDKEAAPEKKSENATEK
jgi:preprotein translocase subunit YajC